MLKNKIAGVILLMFGAILLSSCGGIGASQNQSTDEEAADVAAVAETEGNAMKAAMSPTALGLKLLQLQSLDKSACVSPASLNMALSLALEGAKGNTQKELAQFLAHPLNASLNALAQEGGDGQSVTIANALWSDTKVKPNEEYVKSIHDKFGASAESVPFSSDPEKAASSINEWVKENTKGLIDKLVTSSDVLRAEVVLTNALYFIGEWTQPFNVKATAQAPFHATSGKKKVDMMHQKASFPYAENERFQAIVMPYKDENYGLFVLLPKEGYSLAQLSSELQESELKELMSAMNHESVQLAFPKFDTKELMQLTPALRALGLETPFSSSADFSGIFEDGNGLPIEKILQAIRFKVDETKTEAAAATGVVMTRAMVTDEKNFIADHPFLYFVFKESVDNSLFIGVFDPQ